ncbi:ethanolamine ammonia-lyase subunit EutC, partial [Haloferax profundi]|uniref:ethanolamine ammonia-lyase subunit EutC n=1 Tax=Haloferax profundi TaxID=1544718 RepID=UPI0009E9D0C1
MTDDPPTTNNESASSELSQSLESSPSRLGVGRAGTRPPTRASLEFRADHAKARDAVLTRVSEKIIQTADLFAVDSLVDDQDEYLARPDLGRDISDETANALRENCTVGPDVQIVVCDGLSSTAVEANIKDLLPVLITGLNDRGFKVGTPVFVRFGRVNVMDAIGEELSAKSVVNLIGERP